MCVCIYIYIYIYISGPSKSSRTSRSSPGRTSRASRSPPTKKLRPGVRAGVSLTPQQSGALVLKRSPCNVEGVLGIAGEARAGLFAQGF